MAFGAETAQIRQVVGAVDLDRVKSRLFELASLNGQLLDATEGHPAPHYATNRPALSLEDKHARNALIRPWMEQAGLEVTDHPLAVIGRLRGKDSEKSPLLIMSHVDTVPDGDMYDGTLGVVGGTEVVEAMRKSEIEPEQDVIVLALTGEESAVFGFPLFGSLAIFHGLPAKARTATDKNGRSLDDHLGEADSSIARQPYFDSLGLPGAAVELHVEQASRLEKQNADIGLVEVIAAPERFHVRIGNAPLRPDIPGYDHEEFYELRVNGRADHSGTTPMDPEARADGLLAAADFLHMLVLDDNLSPGALTIGEITVDQGSMNKIPGLTTVQLRIASNDEDEVAAVSRRLQSALEDHNSLYKRENNGFTEKPFELADQDRKTAGSFFDSHQIIDRQLTAFSLIERVNTEARRLAARGVVGTVGTYKTTPDGFIELDVDCRGTDLDTRNRLVASIQRWADTDPFESVDLGEPIASGTPVTMNADLIDMAYDDIQALGLSVEEMPCMAGHDIQNAVRAGVPGLLMLCQSNNNGLSHNPEAYTADEHLLSGVKALAAVVARLSIEGIEL